MIKAAFIKQKIKKKHILKNENKQNNLKSKSYIIYNLVISIILPNIEM